jgi:hypothetical protein
MERLADEPSSRMVEESHHDRHLCGDHTFSRPTCADKAVMDRKRLAGSVAGLDGHGHEIPRPDLDEVPSGQFQHHRTSAGAEEGADFDPCPTQVLVPGVVGPVQVGPVGHVPVDICFILSCAHLNGEAGRPLRSLPCPGRQGLTP